jgi:hypothetical protein
MQFLEPWTAVGEFASNLVAELEREVIEGHVLFGKDVVAIAQRTDSDDVLFRMEDGSGYAVVHLTWNGEPEHSSKWPEAKLFSTLDEWLADGMERDHQGT